MFVNRNDLENNKASCAANGLGAKVIYFAIGGGIGAALALLFAPKPGRELRGDIADAASHGYDRARETVGRVKEQGEIFYETAREKGEEIYSAAFRGASDFKEELTEDAAVLGDMAERTAKRVVRAIKN